MTPLRIVNVILGLMMVGFTAVQYNDPDMPLWVLMYAVPAIWMYAVTYRLQGVLGSPDIMRLLWATAVFYVVAVIFLWPAMPNFWRKEVWIVEETAREGMGVMIALGVVLIAVLNTRLKSAARVVPGNAAAGKAKRA